MKKCLLFLLFLNLNSAFAAEKLTIKGHKFSKKDKMAHNFTVVNVTNRAFKQATEYCKNMGGLKHISIDLNKGGLFRYVCHLQHAD